MSIGSEEAAAGEPARDEPDEVRVPTHDVETITLKQATAVWLRIGLLGFGGPAGQIALMHGELVEKRGWISEPRFLHALNYCMILPGPEAQQLAIYIGWLLHRTLGGLIAGIAFVLPGLAAILALSVVYVGVGDVPAVTALFLGLKAAVLAIVVQAVIRIGRRALRTRTALAIAMAAFFAIVMLDVPFPLVILVAAGIGLLASARPSGIRVDPASMDVDGAQRPLVDRALAARTRTGQRPAIGRTVMTTATWLAIWWLPVIAVAVMAGPDSVLARQGVFFSQAAVIGFGGAYAVLAYVAQRMVEDFRWLTPGQMIDGLALAETTPGPLILVLPLVAFVAAFQHETVVSPWAAAMIAFALSTWVTFVPCFLWIFLGAPYVESLRGHRRLDAALSAVTAAVVGVILALALWFGTHVLFGEIRQRQWHGIRIDMPVLSSLDSVALTLTLLAFVVLFLLRWSMFATLILLAGAGVTIHLLAPVT